MTMINDGKFEEELTCRFKTDMSNLTNFDSSIQKSQKFATLMGSFWTKYIMLELKKCGGAMFHDTEGWCKIWRKTDFWPWKWHEEFGKGLPEHSKVSKLELWYDHFIQIRKCMRLKITDELCVMTKNNNEKLEEELTCCFKMDMRNLKNFGLSTRMSPKFCTLMGSFWTKYMSELKKYRGVMFYDTEDWRKLWRKTELWFGKWQEEFRKFSPEDSKVSKLGLWWDLFIQSRKRMNLKFTEELCIMKNGEWWKIKRGIDLLIHNWHNSLTNIDPSTQMPHSTICTLMGSFWPKYVMFELKK